MVSVLLEFIVELKRRNEQGTKYINNHVSYRLLSGLMGNKQGSKKKSTGLGVKGI